MMWRALLMAVLLTGLAGCEDSATVRYKVIVQAEVDGKLVEGSSVMEMKYTLTPGSLHGYGASTVAKGEATVLDLGERGKLFVLPRGENGSLSQYYEFAVLQSVGIKGSVGGLNKVRISDLLGLQVDQKFDLKFSLRPGGINIAPLMVVLTDENDPASVVQVTKDNFEELFGKDARFKGISIEITDEPVTSGLVEKRLPLLGDRKRIWATLPRGVPVSELPLKDKWGWRYFYVKECWHVKECL